LKGLLIPQVALLGDHAFHSAPNVVPPFHPNTMAAPKFAKEPATIGRMRHFNYDHSSDRMCAEHGNSTLKKWGIVRGRCDIELFQSTTAFKKNFYCTAS
jgi:hypothetical protein